MEIVKNDYREQLLEAIKSIDTADLNDDLEIVSTSTVIEEQKIYFWIRLYLREEDLNIEIGDEISIKYQPLPIFVDGKQIIDSGITETLETKFICYGKKGLDKDHDNQVVNFSNEDDKKILCLMVDERVVNFGTGIDFIRTLFKTGHHYQYQLIKREELLFLNKRNGHILEYFDCDF